MNNKRVFSEEERNYIIDNWDKESIYSMKNKLNCSWYAIANVGKEYGLELPKSNAWTDEEINTLIKLAKIYKLEDIAKKMNKTNNAIYLKARKLGIVLEKEPRKWSSEEEQILSELWGNISIEKLASKLKRSIFSLKVKAVRMGLGPMISNNTDVLTISDIVDILNVTRDRINTWIKYGLNVQNKVISKNKKYYYVEWDDLIDFLRQHQDLWDANKVDMYMLGEETDWLKEKRKKDALNKPLLYKVWTNDEKNKTINYFKLGYSYRDIAKLLNRSEVAIKIFLNNNGYYMSDKNKWNDEDLEFLKNNYTNMTYQQIANYLHKTKASVEYKAYKNGYSKRLVKKYNYNMEDNYE